ncbi:hypothetical protein C4357_11065, partial [Clostridioides difficile]|nr:hypothetical protein [Clostridioides difficile]
IYNLFYIFYENIHFLPFHKSEFSELFSQKKYTFYLYKLIFLVCKFDAITINLFSITNLFLSCIFIVFLNFIFSKYKIYVLKCKIFI